MDVFLTDRLATRRKSMHNVRTDLPLRLRQFAYRNRYTWLAFALPFLILMTGYFTRLMWPIGDRNILTIDLYHQYAPFLAELQTKYATADSLFYTWAGGLGVNFYSLFAYYLSSPLNILIVLFPPSFLTEAITFLTLVKFGLAGAFFYRFLRGAWQKDSLLMVTIALFYALSGYSLAYSWDIMWLDGVALLPLILLGMVKLIRDRQWLLYCIALGLVFLSNFYIAFFVLFFSVLYFPVCLAQFNSWRRPRQLFASIGRFVLFTGLGLMLSAVLLLPTYFSMKLTSAAGDRFPSTFQFYYDLFDYIGQHFMLTPPTIRDGMPNMYSGVLTLLLVPMYFLAKSVPLKQKFWNLGLLLVMIMSFNINILNFIWHGMHFPNQLPYRYSFVFIFLILSIAYPALQSLREFTGKQIGAIALAVAGVVLLAQKLIDKAPEIQVLIATIVFVAIYAAVLTLDRVRRMTPADMALAILIVAVIEMMLNVLVTLHKIDTTEYYSSREGYFKGVEVDQMRQELANIARTEAGGFYRVESLPPKTTNDGFMYNYDGLSIFASTMPTKPVRLFQNLGFHSNGINSYKYEGSTVVLDSLFGIKYLIRRSGSIDDRLRQSIVKTSEIEVFKNPYALSLGYLGRPELSAWSSSSSNCFEAQNSLLTALTGSDDVFAKLPQSEGDLVNMTFTSTTGTHYNFRRVNESQEGTAKVLIGVETDQQVYLYLDVNPNQPDRGFVMVDGQRVDFNAKRATLIDLGFVKAGANVEFNIVYNSESSSSGYFNLYAYGLNQASFAQAMSTLQQQSLQISDFRDGFVEGTVNAANDGVFLLTVPYDKGWRIKVDGKPVEYRALDSGLIYFNMTAGEHRITMHFVPEWFFVGLLVSLAALLLILLLYLIPRSRRVRARGTAARETADVRPVEIRPIGPAAEADEVDEVQNTAAEVQEIPGDCADIPADVPQDTNTP
jgi:uncharacterized membrane protein YfhO